MNWDVIFDKLANYGVLGIVMSVVLFLLYKYFEKKITNMDKVRQEQISQSESTFKQNNDLIKYVMDNNKESMNELKNAIDKLSEHIKNSSGVYDKIINNISDDINDLKEKYVAISSQLIETILDNNSLSKRVFYDISKLIILKYIYKCVISINNLFDANGLTTQEKITLLKDNVAREMERHSNEAKAEIQALSYDKDKIEVFLQKLSPVKLKYKEIIKNELMDSITIDSLSKDLHFYSIKQLIRNRLYEFSEQSQNILKEILR